MHAPHACTTCSTQERTDELELVQHLVQVAGADPESSGVQVGGEHAKVGREALPYHELQELARGPPLVHALLIRKLNLHSAER